jgi:hypothetical protein
MRSQSSLLVAGLIALPLFGQNEMCCVGVIRGPGAGEPTIPAYSADQISEHTQTLPDGTRIAQRSGVTHFYRDSSGRTRTETFPISPPGSQAMALPQVWIADPVAGAAFTLDAQAQVAHKTSWPKTSSRPPLSASGAANNSGAGARRADTASTASQSGVPGPETKSEDLGERTIEGVVAWGHRITTTWAAGAVGNDRPIVGVDEFWYSAQLGDVVLHRKSDPRSGETVIKFTSIRFGEPDPSLFAPPPDYMIVDK